MTTHKSHGSLLLLLSCLLVSHWLFEAETSYGLLTGLEFLILPLTLGDRFTGKHHQA